MDLVVFGALVHDIGKTNDFNDWSSDKNTNLLMVIVCHFLVIHMKVHT